MISNEAPPGPSDDFVATVEQRLNSVRSELAEARQEIEALNTRTQKLQTEEAHLRDLIATYRGVPSSSLVRDGARAFGRRATRDDVVALLASVGTPMHYQEIETHLRSSGLFTGGGQDPANALLASYYNDPRLERIGRGTYQLKNPSGAAADCDTPGTLSKLLSDPSFRSRTVTDGYLTVLSYAYAQKPSLFEKVLAISGRNRLYFARTEEEIRCSGASTQPRQIPGTPFWAMCNDNTEALAARLEQALQELGYASNEALAAGEAIKRLRR